MPAAVPISGAIGTGDRVECFGAIVLGTEPVTAAIAVDKDVARAAGIRGATANERNRAQCDDDCQCFTHSFPPYEGQLRAFEEQSANRPAMIGYRRSVWQELMVAGFVRFTCTESGPEPTYSAT